MGEKRRLFKKKIEYSGLVDVNDLHKIMKTFMTDKQYIYDDPEYEESSSEDSRSFKQKIQFSKKPSDYVKHIFKVKYSGSNVKNVEVERAEHKVMMQEAKIKIEIEGIIETDYEGVWSIDKNWFFIKTIFNRFFFTKELEPDNKMLIDTGEALVSRIKSFLNLYQY